MLFVRVIVILVHRILKRQTFNDKTCSYLACFLARQVRTFIFYGLGFFIDRRNVLVNIGMEILLN